MQGSATETVGPSGGTAGAHPARRPVVEMRGITRRFPGVLANDGVDFELAPGEIHALLGENGAGKTTLMNVLCGLYKPDSGEIRVNGRTVHFHSPRDAIASGIGMVHQHFMLVESFTVADNIVLGQKSPRSPLREERSSLYERLQALSDRYGLRVDPAAEVWQLSVGEQQRVEILKAIYRGARILILDEPTAVLTPQEVDGLLETLRGLAGQGTSIVFISHKLKEVLAVSDRVTVLRDGRAVATIPTAECDERELARLMVGREVNLSQSRGPYRPGEERLVVRDLWVDGDRGLPALRGITLAVRAGEIVGVAGVDGNGQRELEEAISGLRPVARGQIELRGRLAHIPSDRYEMGLLPDFSVAENLALRDIEKPPFTVRGLLRPAEIARFGRSLAQRYGIRTRSVRTPVGTLSGGNAQRVVLARELSHEHRVVLAAQPTRGLDVSAIEYTHSQLIARRDAGAAVLLISTELEEILALSDRIVVLYEGRIVGTLDREDVDINRLGLMMAGRADG